MKLLARALAPLSYMRKCIYYEAFLLERHSGSGSLVLPALMVGVFESPPLFALLILVERLLLAESVIRTAFPSSIAAFYSLIWFLAVGALELIYFRVLRNDIEIIETFDELEGSERNRIRRVALVYATTALAGGATVIYFSW